MTMLHWLGACTLFLIGLFLGFLLGRFSQQDRKAVYRLQQKLNATEHEYRHYKDTIAEHFASTSELVNQMTACYQSIHQHLANGAEQLCQDSSLVKKLNDPSPHAQPLPRRTHAAPPLAGLNSPAGYSGAADAAPSDPVGVAPKDYPDKGGFIRDKQVSS